MRNNMITKWWAVIAVLAVLSVLALAGCSDDKPAEVQAPAASTTTTTAAAKKTAATPKIGQPAKDGPLTFTVTGLTCGIPKVGGEFGTAAQGEFCRMSVKVTNTGNTAQAMGYNQYTFDAKGRQYTASDLAAIYDSAASTWATQINPGSTFTSRLYYDVAKGTKLVRAKLHRSELSDGVTVVLTK